MDRAKLREQFGADLGAHVATIRKIKRLAAARERLRVFTDNLSQEIHAVEDEKAKFLLLEYFNSSGDDGVDDGNIDPNLP